MFCLFSIVFKKTSPSFEKPWCEFCHFLDCIKQNLKEDDQGQFFGIKLRKKFRNKA